MLSTGKTQPLRKSEDLPLKTQGTSATTPDLSEGRGRRIQPPLQPALPAHVLLPMSLGSLLFIPAARPALAQPPTLMRWINLVLGLRVSWAVRLLSQLQWQAAVTA